MTYKRLIKHSLQVPTGIAALVSAALLAPGVATPALAQTSPTQMSMDWPMTLGMVAFCILVIVVLILGAAALVKYLFFR